MNDKLIQFTGYLYSADILYIVGSIASVIGLLITVWIWFKVKRIENQFLFRVRFPVLRRQIGRHSATISSHLNSFPSSANELEVELKKCQANLKSLTSKLSGSPKTSAIQILKNIKKLPSPLVEQSKQAVREVHLGLVLLEQDLDNLKEDLQWRSNQ